MWHSPHKLQELLSENCFRNRLLSEGIGEYVAVRKVGFSETKRERECVCV